jgi:hypothetical protein
VTSTGASKSNASITSSTKDKSGVLVKKGSLTLKNTNVTTSGNSSSTDDSSFYGLNAAVLALAGTSVTQTGGTVTTTGSGANGIFSYGENSKIAVSGTTINASGDAAHGIMASGGGSITAKDLTVTTKGQSSAAVATDRGSGTIDVDGGTYTTSGYRSPGLYSTGKLTATDATFVAKAAEAAVVEGSNSVVAKNSDLTGATNGVMIYQSMSGDAEGSNGSYTQTGGSLTAKKGAAFYVTNGTAKISLDNVKISAKSGTLLKAAADQWGTSGSNGGTAKLTATDQTLKGNVVVDKVSTAALTLKDGSTLTGAIDHANTAKSVTLTLDSSSTWSVTADSHVGKLTGLKISGKTVSNISGNGHTVYYDSSANPDLDGKTYTLADGGTLTPES